MNAPDQQRTEDAFHKLIHGNSIYGLWEIASQMTPHPLPDAVPHIWKAALLESLVKQSATAVPMGDERRAMQLFNPGLKGAWATTSTLIAAVQVLLPGEIARTHRHSPSAIRFIIQGSGAYTAVEGEKVIMHEGDLVLTPNWQWHDHGNQTDHMVVWMDGLDVPLTKALNSMFFGMYHLEQFPSNKPVNGSQALYGHGRLSPTWMQECSLYSPLMLYSWDQTQEALHAMRDRDGSPFEGMALEYTHPQTGGPALPTMGCQVQLIRKGEKLKARHVAGSSIFHVRQGRGRSIINGEVFEWGKGDIFVVPSWALHEHASGGGENAILFSINDHPVMKKLGFYREEALADNGGFQVI